MPAFRTKNDVQVKLWERPFLQDYTIPKGTEVIPVENAVQRPLAFAVRSIEFLTRLTGSEHDAKHRYCFISSVDVEEVK